MSAATEPATRLSATALHDAALKVICPQCLAQPGIACLPVPRRAGHHIARYSRAYANDRITAAEATAVFDAAPVIANWAVVTIADLAGTATEPTRASTGGSEDAPDTSA